METAVKTSPLILGQDYSVGRFTTRGQHLAPELLAVFEGDSAACERIRPMSDIEEDVLPFAFGASDFLLVAIHRSGAPIGVVTCMMGKQHRFAIETLINESGDDTAIIQDLVVVPDYRNRGVGRSLFAAAHQRIRTADLRYIAIKAGTASNRHVIRWLQNRDFSLIHDGLPNDRELYFKRKTNFFFDPRYLSGA